MQAEASNDVDKETGRLNAALLVSQCVHTLPYLLQPKCTYSDWMVFRLVCDSSVLSLPPKFAVYCVILGISNYYSVHRICLRSSLKLRCIDLIPQFFHMSYIKNLDRCASSDLMMLQAAMAVILAFGLAASTCAGAVHAVDSCLLSSRPLCRLCNL